MIASIILMTAMTSAVLHGAGAVDNLLADASVAAQQQRGPAATALRCEVDMVTCTQ